MVERAYSSLAHNPYRITCTDLNTTYTLFDHHPHKEYESCCMLDMLSFPCSESFYDVAAFMILVYDNILTTD